MLTVIETPLFSKLWPAYWSEDERGAFAAFIAEHPEEGMLCKVLVAFARCAGAVRARANQAVCG
jgi:hypothetical protein